MCKRSIIVSLLHNKFSISVLPLNLAKSELADFETMIRLADKTVRYFDEIEYANHAALSIMGTKPNIYVESVPF